MGVGGGLCRGRSHSGWKSSRPPSTVPCGWRCIFFVMNVFDVVVSSPPPEPEVTWGAAWRLLVALPVGFLLLLGIFWAGIALAGYLRRHAGKIKSNLGATPEEPPEEKP